MKTSVQAVFNTQQDIGKGIRAMLVTRMAQANKVVVVERAKMATLMKEQDFNASNRVKQGQGARVGQISGADALLSGDIVVFGRDDKKRSVKGGGLIGGVIGGIASSKNEDKAVVVIDYRLIDAETSEIIATGEASGESVRKGNALGAIGGALGKGVAGVQIDMTSSNFAQTIIGEATQDCVNKLADILLEQTANMKKTVREVEDRVADVSGKTLVITVGRNDGVNVGRDLRGSQHRPRSEGSGHQGSPRRSDRENRRDDHHQRARQNRHRDLYRDRPPKSASWRARKYNGGLGGSMNPRNFW